MPNHIESNMPAVLAFTINPYEKDDYKPIDIVSGHIALGTGLISSILSSVTDFFGAKSKGYGQKMKEAEDACLIMIKQNAHALNADAIVGMSTTFTELTSGHGQLLVFMSGTAIKLNK